MEKGDSAAHGASRGSTPSGEAEQRQETVRTRARLPPLPQPAARHAPHGHVQADHRQRGGGQTGGQGVAQRAQRGIQLQSGQRIQLPDHALQLLEVLGTPVLVLVLVQYLGQQLVLDAQLGMDQGLGLQPGAWRRRGCGGAGFTPQPLQAP